MGVVICDGTVSYSQPLSRDFIASVWTRRTEAHLPGPLQAALSNLLTCYVLRPAQSPPSLPYLTWASSF